MNAGRDLTTELEAITLSMADALRRLYERPSRERYCEYLRVMYHYTREAGEELRYAASIAPHEELRRLFERFAREEAHHYRLAMIDLSDLGAWREGDVPASVIAYRAFWRGIGAHESWQHLGALFVLENVARVSQDEGLRAMGSLGLTERQTRFVLEHVEADANHGRDVADCAARFALGHGAEILAGARRGAELWIAMHLAVLEAERGAQ